MSFDLNSRELETVKIEDIRFDADNPNEMNDLQMQALDQSFEKWGYVDPIVIDQNNVVANGEHRVKILEAKGYTEIPVLRFEFANDMDRRLFRQTFNKLHGSHNKVKDAQELYALMQAGQMSMLSQLIAQDEQQIQAIMTYYHPDKSLFSNQALKDMGAATGAGSLAANWGMPPFSVLDRRTTTWQKRKQEWINFGITSELGRNEGTKMFTKDINKFQKPKDEASKDQVSIFDPVLTELMCRWFTTPDIYQGATVLDPFAGGSVRGIVNGFLGNRYIGVDINPAQIEENERQYDAIKHKFPERTIQPDWRIGDSQNIDTLVTAQDIDFMITSPPFWNLEKYSDQPGDISNMDWHGFRNNYSTIMEKCIKMLKPGAFAAINMSNIRDKQTGFLINLVDFTTELFEMNGMRLYNEFVIVHPIFTLQFRAGRSFMSRRTVGKQHEFMLVYYKGNPKDIEQILPKHIVIPEDIDQENMAQETKDLLLTK